MKKLSLIPLLASSLTCCQNKQKTDLLIDPFDEGILSYAQIVLDNQNKLDTLQTDMMGMTETYLQPEKTYHVKIIPGESKQADQFIPYETIFKPKENGITVISKKEFSKTL